MTESVYHDKVCALGLVYCLQARLKLFTRETDFNNVGMSRARENLRVSTNLCAI